GRRLSKVHRATEWLKPSFARSSATMSASVRDQMPKPSCVSCQLGSPTTTRFTRTRLSDIVHPVSSSQLTQDPDRVRSFGGYNTLLSCAHPYKHGVVGNDWIDKKTGRRLYSTEDARFKYLDEETPDHSGTSPFNMKVTTVGDELIYANGKSKVIAIAGKDRSAIGLAGQYGTAYMHSATTGRFITSNYYMEDYPDWWKRFYETKPQNKYFKETWSLLLPEEAYARSTSDDRPWTTKYKDLGTRFPHPIVGGAKEASKAYYDAMMWTPFGALVPFVFIKAAIEGENLGNNPAGVPDILAISWPSHDYVNHLFGPESRQSQDQAIRL